MRYLGLLAALVVMVCVFAYVTRLSSPSPDAANSNSYGETINAVRSTVQTAGGPERRRKWAIAQQMKSQGFADPVSYSTEGAQAENLIAVSGSMNSLLCSKIADGEVGSSAAAAGFASISCRTNSGVTVVERGFR